MRTLKALAAALAVATILMEALRAGLVVLLPPELLYTPLPVPVVHEIAWPLLPVNALIWLLGGLIAGIMASGLARHWAAGLLAGLLLGCPAVLIIGLALPGSTSMLTAAALPLIGALAGSRLIVLLEREPLTPASPTGQAL